MKGNHVIIALVLLLFGGCGATDKANNRESAIETALGAYDQLEVGMPTAKVLELMGPCDFYFPGDFIRGPALMWKNADSYVNASGVRMQPVKAVLFSRGKGDFGLVYLKHVTSFSQSQKYVDGAVGSWDECDNGPVFSASNKGKRQITGDERINKNNDDILKGVGL